MFSALSSSFFSIGSRYVTLTAAKTIVAKESVVWAQKSDASKKVGVRAISYCTKANSRRDAMNMPRDASGR